MPQIILKERTAHLATYTLFTRDVDQYKHTYFHNSINHQEHLFHRTLITSCFRPANIARNNFLRTNVLQNTSRSSRLQMFFKISIIKIFSNFVGKHLCQSLILKNFQAEGLQLHEKKSPTQFNFFFTTHCLMYKKSNSFVYKFVVSCQVTK